MIQRQSTSTQAQASEELLLTNEHDLTGDCAIGLQQNNWQELSCGHHITSEVLTKYQI